MAIGDVFEVTAGGCTDVYYVDTGMYDLPEFGSVYVVDAERPAVVDTGIGTDAERVLAALSEVGIEREEVEVIAPTHVHLDHAGGAGFLADACPNADVYVHSIGAPHLVDPERLVEGTKRAVGDLWQFYTDPLPVPADRIVELEDGDAVDLGDRTLEVHHVPGHAPHQVAFYDRRDGALFAGDAAGKWIPALDRVAVTTPPPNFDHELWQADTQRLLDLDPSVVLYGHFGPRGMPQRVLEAHERVLDDWVTATGAARDELGDGDAVVERFVQRSELDEVWPTVNAREEVRMNVEGVLLYHDRRG